MLHIDLLVQESTTIKLYEKLFNSSEFFINNTTILNKTHHQCSSNLILIDITNTKGLQLLELISFEKNSYIIFISPFTNEFLKLPPNFNSSTKFFFTKPFKMEKFHLVLNNCKLKIEKQNYLQAKENILIKTIDDSPLRIAIYDLEGAIVYANQPYMILNEMEDFYHSHFEDLKYCTITFKDVVHNLKLKNSIIIERQHENKWFKSLFYLAGDSNYIVHLCTDQTEEKNHINDLKKASQFFEKSSEGAIITDQYGTILLVNDSFCSITGYTKDDSIGRSTDILNSGIHEKSFYENMWDSLKHHGKWQGEIWNKRKNGEIYPEWLSITKIEDVITKEINYMAIFSDITSLKEADKKLYFYANHDPLTSLINKTQFENMLEQTIKSSTRNKRKFALLFIDLDHFKEVNDTAGHDVGDLVLKQTATRLQKTLRKEDIIARIGGDEFNVLIDNINEEKDLLFLADKLNQAIKEPYVIQGRSFLLSLSIGIAIFPEHGTLVKTLSKHADAAMYEVKKNGRDGCLLYSKSFTETLEKKVSLLIDLRKAIQDEQFELYYQIVVESNTKQISGAEALLRWNHPQKGFISPEEFIPLAENHGLIEKIGKFVLKQACEDLPNLLNKFGKEFILAINISSKEFSNENYIEYLNETIKDFHVSAKNIELEITETYIMENHLIATDHITSLREKGFKIAIDDFGTGYSSLSYLKKFPANKLKIDKSFILDMVEDKDDEDLVKAIINIAKIFKLEVQAEGIETKQHLEKAIQLGVDIIQGYYHSKPMPLNKILLKNWNIKNE